MSSSWTFTARMGETKDKVVLGPGTPIAGSDAIELTVDATRMSRREFAATLRTVAARALETAFPASTEPNTRVLVARYPAILAGFPITFGAA